MNVCCGSPIDEGRNAISHDHPVSATLMFSTSASAHRDAEPRAPRSTQRARSWRCGAGAF
jgi:hypothetical protein